jgi:phage baseplate assembly protein W
MATLQDVTTQNWQLSAAAPGQIVQGVLDIIQCVDVILTTQRGSDPFRPDFGVDIMSFIDEPINTAVPILVREITAQITRWEPRVRLTSVKHKVEGSQIILETTWDSPLGQGSNTAIFRL